MKTSFYLAGDYEHRENLLEHASTLVRLFNWVNNATWLSGLHDADVPMWFSHYARQDLNDVRDSDMLILAHALRPTIRGGKFIEFGYACALNKPIHLVFDVPLEAIDRVEELKKTAIFYMLPNVQMHNGWDAFHDNILMRIRMNKGLYPE